MQVLRISKMLEQRAWAFRHPLRQLGNLPFEIYDKLEAKRASVDTLRDLDVKEIGALISNMIRAPPSRRRLVNCLYYSWT